jgi:hypothetical protein
MDVPMISVMSSPATSPDAALRWYGSAFPVEAMLMPRREARPFGVDREEPGPEDQA